MTSINLSDMDTEEAKRRAQWLHDHKAPVDWVILTTSEVAAMKHELAARNAERSNSVVLKTLLIDLRQRFESLGNAILKLEPRPRIRYPDARDRQVLKRVEEVLK